MKANLKNTKVIFEFLTFIDLEAIKNAEINDLKEELRLEKEKSEELKSNLNASNVEIKSLKSELEVKTSTILSLQSKIDESLDKIESLKAALAKLDKELNLKILESSK